MKFKGIYDIFFGQSDQLTENTDATNGKGFIFQYTKAQGVYLPIFERCRAKCRYTKPQGVKRRYVKP